MRIAFLTQRFPFPLDNGGNIRTFHLLKGLAKQHKVHLIAECPRDVNVEDLGEVTELCESVDLADSRSHSFVADIVRGAWNLRDQRPYVLMRHYNLSLLEVFRRRLAATTVDAIHLNHLDTVLYLPFVKRPPVVVIDEHNVVTSQVERTIPLEPSFVRRFALKADVQRIRRVEAQACNDATAVLACSEIDAAMLADLGVRKPVIVVPNGVDLDQFKPRARPGPKGHDLVFVGALDYDPCDKGVRDFCEFALPAVLEKSPDTRFIVVGRNPSKALRAMVRAQPQIVLTGSVPDVRPHVQGAAVFVVPLLSGSGTRLKILEAMALGIPVVTTTVGVEGIAASHGEHCFVADGAGNFAEAVLRVLADEERAERVAENARKLVEQRYGWQRSVNELQNLYAQLAPDNPS